MFKTIMAVDAARKVTKVNSLATNPKKVEQPSSIVSISPEANERLAAEQARFNRINK
jgi:hypothetical protein